MKTLKITKAIYKEMESVALSAAPLEACGFLAGTGELVTKIYTLTNEDASAEHYSMIPKEQFATIKDIRNNSLESLAIWHSHPATPPRMSKEDLRLAYTPDIVYVIISLADNKTSIAGFEVIEGEPEKINIEIIKD